MLSVVAPLRKCQGHKFFNETFFMTKTFKSFSRLDGRTIRENKLARPFKIKQYLQRTTTYKII